MDHLLAFEHQGLRRLVDLQTVTAVYERRVVEDEGETLVTVLSVPGAGTFTVTEFTFDDLIERWQAAKA